MGDKKSISKTTQTLKLIVISALSLLSSSILSLISGRVVLTSIGSDYNGLNSIVSQFVMIISLAEGGFTTASLVALFKPFEEKDIDEINNILGETAKQFYRIGLVALSGAVLLSFGYAFLIHSPIAYIEIALILFVSALTSIISIVFLTRYRLLFQVSQQEHTYALFLLVANACSSLGTIIIIHFTHSVILSRLFQLLCIIICAFAVGTFVSHRYKDFSYKKWDNVKRVKGTGDVVVTKIVGVLHTTSSTFFLSLFSTTALTSVYAVYYNVVHIISSVVNIGVSSTQNALGKTIHEKDGQRINDVLNLLELVVLICLVTLFIPTAILIVSFVKIYTSGVNDVEYTNYTLATLLILSVFFQLSHIPSGLKIYLSGMFEVAKKIQIIGLIVLGISTVVMGYFWNIYGVLFSRLLCDIVLFGLEIYYAHYGTKELIKFISHFCVNFVLLVGLTVAMYPMSKFVNGSIVRFCIIGAVTTILGFVSVLGVNYLLFRADMKNLFGRAKTLLNNIKMKRRHKK